MRALTICLLALVVGCKTTPDAGPAFGGLPNTPVLPKVARTPDAFDEVQEMVVTGSGGVSDVSSVAYYAPNLEIAPTGTADADEEGANPIPREVIYTADLGVVVVSIEQSTRAVQSLAEKIGGYLQESDSISITVRVPAPKFESTIEQIATLGEVVERSISASDVTEEFLNLNIRLDNANRTRARLLEHLAHSKKIGDTLKIEAELSRVSETIEEMEGKLRYMRSQIAMSTITVGWTARTTSQPGAPTLGLPFQWIEELGDGLVAGQVEQRTRDPRLFDFGPKFEPPADFIRYFSSRYLVEALSADGLRIKVRRHDNHDRGELGFWKDLAHESLVRSRALAVTSEQDLGDGRAVITGTREVGGQTLGYMLLLKRTNKRVYSFEAWGPKATFDEHAAALEKSAKSLRH